MGSFGLPAPMKIKTSLTMDTIIDESDEEDARSTRSGRGRSPSPVDRLRRAVSDRTGMRSLSPARSPSGAVNKLCFY